MSEGLTAAHLVAFNAALLVAVAAPGPAFLVCVQSALRGGFREGALAGLGLALVAGLWTLAALLGLELLFETLPAAYAALRIGGAIVLLWIAWRTWQGARAPVAAAPASGRRAFARGALLNLGNPKSILFSAGVLLIIVPPDLAVAEMALVTLNHVALEAAFYAGVAALMSSDAVRLRYLAARPTIMRITALVLGGLGLRLLVAQ